jgi:hypothetical protein
MYTEICIQLFQLIKVVPKQSGKVEYERERLLHGIANKLMNLLAIPSGLSRSYSEFASDSQQPFALVFDFSALLGDNLN